MTTARINFTGSTFLGDVTLSTAPGSMYNLADIRGFDEGPEIDRETEARWNGKGSFVSSRAKVPLRVVEVEFDANLTTLGFNNLMADLSRMRNSRNISLTVNRGTRNERLISGFVSTPATVSRMGNFTIVRLVIDFANPFITDVSSGNERL